jgi:hypothetical protein
MKVELLATSWTVRGSNPGGGEIFLTRPDRSWVIPRGKAARSWRCPPTSPSAEVKERVEIYLYFPLGLDGLFLGDLYPYLLPLITTSCCKVEFLYIPCPRLIVQHFIQQTGHSTVNKPSPRKSFIAVVCVKLGKWYLVKHYCVS